MRALSGIQSSYIVQRVTQRLSPKLRAMQLPGLFVVLIILAVILSACAESEPVEVRKITVANTEEYSTLIWIAQAQGYFADNNLDVTTKDYQAGLLAADALFAGDVDIAVSSEFVLVGQSFNNRNFRILGTVDTATNIELIAKKGTGILDPRDLKGKKIGVTINSGGEFVLGTFITLNGLSNADVEIVDLKPKDMTNALLQGDVDAVVTWQPNVFDIKQELGDEVLSWPAQGGRNNMVLVTEEELIRDNPEAIRQFLKSIVQAEEYVRKNSAATRRLIAEKYGYDSSYMDDTWSGHRFTVELSQDLLSTMEDQARWRIDHDLTDATKVPNYLNFIDIKALEAVAPDAVTIIR